MTVKAEYINRTNIGTYDANMPTEFEHPPRVGDYVKPGVRYVLIGHDERGNAQEQDRIDIAFEVKAVIWLGDDWVSLVIDLPSLDGPMGDVAKQLGKAALQEPKRGSAYPKWSFGWR